MSEQEARSQREQQFATWCVSAAHASSLQTTLSLREHQNKKKKKEKKKKKIQKTNVLLQTTTKQTEDEEQRIFTLSRGPHQNYKSCKNHQIQNNKTKQTTTIDLQVLHTFQVLHKVCVFVCLFCGRAFKLCRCCAVGETETEKKKKKKKKKKKERKKKLLCDVTERQHVWAARFLSRDNSSSPNYFFFSFFCFVFFGFLVFEDVGMWQLELSGA